MLSPREIFEDNIRPAELLLKVYRLLEHDAPSTDGKLVGALRGLVRAEADEGLMVIYNEIFLGLIRERAEVPPASIKRSALCNLLRQSAVTACTALETYLPTLLRNELPEVIKLRGREFVPKDKEITEQFKNLSFNLEESVRLLTNPDPLYIANKMISFVNFSYLSGKRGIHVTGALLALENPWKQIADRLQRGEEDLKKTLDDAVNRRNDIVHRADREKKRPEGAAQPIGYAWTRQAVDTVRVVCLCLDELVAARLKELQAQGSIVQLRGTI
ncbi:MAG: HEPN domain-containing protein [Pirellulales bacterium]